MSSEKNGEWMVAINSKKGKKYNEKISQRESKRILEKSGPRLDEILPPHQLKPLLGGEQKINKSKEVKPSSNNSSKPTTPKKTLPASAKPPKAPKVTQPTKPKNLEGALSQIHIKDLNDYLENLKANFPDSQILWLSNITAYLNTKLNCQADLIFSGRSYQYPSNIIPKEIKSFLNRFLEEIDEKNTLNYYFDNELNNLATIMTKNQPYLGIMVILQLIAQKRPSVCSFNLARSAILLNSYQNRNTIGLRLLWILGQGGFYNDLTTGIKVFQNIMAPVIQMKSYTKFVCDYIGNILKTAKSGEKINLTQDEFFATYDFLVNNSKSGLPKDCQKILSESSAVLLEKYIQSAAKVSNIFWTLFRHIESEQSSLALNGSIHCLLKNSEDCYKIWRMNYKKNTLPSYLLLRKLDNNWSKYSSSLGDVSALTEFLKFIVETNQHLMVSKRFSDETVLEDIELLVESLQEKSAALQKKNSGSGAGSNCCCWLLSSFLLIGAIGGLIAYDTHSHGGVFEKSATGQFLKNIGALPYVEIGWYKTMSTSARGYQWLEHNVPIYYGQVCVWSKPYVALAKDLFKIALNGTLQAWESVKEAAPKFAKWVDQYLPGFPDTVLQYSGYAWATLSNFYQNSFDFFRTKVFVGQLSPENLGKALNQTQLTAAQYYSWFHEKIDAYAKIK